MKIKTIVIDSTLHVDIFDNGKAVVRDILKMHHHDPRFIGGLPPGEYAEKRRTFKSAQTAAKKIRKELGEALQEEGWMESAINELEATK